MNIGLIDIEPNIFNTALMQISHYHKMAGDLVSWAAPLMYDQYDTLYCSSLFTFTNKYLVPKNAICGGTGYNLKKTLPFDCDYDYSIYPNIDHSIVWFSRGCVRKCPFCVVPDKEGVIHPVTPKPLNAQGKYIKVQDNNFFANKHWRINIGKLQEWGVPVSFDGGIDIRLMTDEQAEALSTLKHNKQIKIAWDNPRHDITKKLSILTKHIKPYKIMCYVLIGYWSSQEEDLHRIETLRAFGIDPFVMPFNRNDLYQSRLARYVNHKAIFKSVAWEQYKA